MRNYNDANENVINTYKLNHENQTLQYVTDIKNRYLKFDKTEMTIWDAITLSDSIVDESDPDIHLSQIYHYFQTAENVRQLYPNDEELHLVGLIHDLGKIMLLQAFGALPQWSVVGDIYPVGCQFSDKIVYSEFFNNNPDKYNLYGNYTPNIGLDNVTMSWSHDEYLYQVLKNHQACKLSDQSLRIIRYHSFYAFHTENTYHHLANNDDMQLKPILKQFSQCDLYSKDDNNVLDINNLKPYYIKLINKYCPGIIRW